MQHYAEADLVTRIEDFKAMGFINYFGTQRFGSCGSDTAEVGLAILKKEWEAAVKTILKPRSKIKGKDISCAVAFPLIPNQLSEKSLGVFNVNFFLGSIQEALDSWNKTGSVLAALKKLKGGQVCVWQITF